MLETSEDWENIPFWERHRFIDFADTPEMLEWVKKDKETLELSHALYDCAMYCYENDIPQLIAATLTVNQGIGVDVDVIAKGDNLIEMLEVYTKRLLDLEEYERLSEVKSKVELLGLELPMIENDGETSTKNM